MRFAAQRSVCCWLPSVIITVSWLLAGQPQADGGRTTAITFYDHVLPVLQRRCLSCHQAGRVGAMALGTYNEARPWAAAIREAVRLRRMPPWFADPNYGHFVNDPRLTDEEIRLIDTWGGSGAVAGKQPRHRAASTTVASPEISADLVVTAPRPILIPANKTIEYQYLVFALPFTHDRWVRAAEIRPSDRSVVHHAALYVRERQSAWLRSAVPGVPYDASEAEGSLHDPGADILAIYTPGATAMICPDGMAKKLPAGADLVLQVHYTRTKKPAADQPQIGLAMLSERPAKKILTLPIFGNEVRNPPVEPNLKASVTGTLQDDAVLISLLPPMHLRDGEFDFDIVAPNGRVETLLKVKSHRFDWQLNYVLKTPRLLQKTTVLRWTGTFGNSANNPHSPDAGSEVRSGERNLDEMMIGYFDVAVDTSVDKSTLFSR